MTRPDLRLAESPDADYVALERRIDVAEEDAIRARWKFGRLLLAERRAHGGKQLPHGRLDEICAAVGKRRSAFEREVHWRMTFAERYPTEAEVRTAVRTLGVWTAVRDELAESPPKPKRTEYQRRMEDMSRAFDVLMRPRPMLLPDPRPYVPQGKDPGWRLREALTAAGRVVNHTKALRELDPAPEVRGRSLDEGRRLLAELRAAADEIERRLGQAADADPDDEGES
ncbi:MAG TPA: hypothetical protein VNR66_13980 [Solirubrobacteraceae bacterium]|jgi:hypothetical protein|nr:hypothetical protein [Solirubrobacteraceae bacterium]